PQSQGPIRFSTGGGMLNAVCFAKGRMRGTATAMELPSTFRGHVRDGHLCRQYGADNYDATTHARTVARGRSAMLRRAPPAGNIERACTSACKDSRRQLGNGGESSSVERERSRS